MKQEYIQIILTVIVVAAAVFFVVKRIYNTMSSGDSGTECTKCGPEKVKD
jgi:large-conductance mechanosensitive channel